MQKEPGKKARTSQDPSWLVMISPIYYCLGRVYWHCSVCCELHIAAQLGTSSRSQHANIACIPHFRRGDVHIYHGVGHIYREELCRVA